MKITLGVDKLYYAPITTDDATGTEYGTMVALPGVISIDITPNKSEGALYADDKKIDSYSSISDYTVAIDIASLDEKDRAFLQGHDYDDTNKLTTEKSTDIAPKIGLAFRSYNADGTYKYIKLCNGSFSDNGGSYKTKADKVEYQTKKMTGSFIPRVSDDVLSLVSENTADATTWFTAFGDATIGG